MKFRWVPWYKTTFEVAENRVDFLQRVRQTVNHNDWKEKRSRILGYVYNDRFDIFFRRFFGELDFLQTKERQADWAVILFGKVKQRADEKCVIEVDVILNWLAYLIIAPFIVLPVIGAVLSSQPLFLLISLGVYVITLLFYNLRAHVLYNFFLKILHNKPNFY